SYRFLHSFPTRRSSDLIGFVDGCSASAFLDLDRTIDDSRLIAMSPPRWCDDCSASRVPAATGARSSYRWISRSSLMPSSPPKSRSEEHTSELHHVKISY